MSRSVLYAHRQTQRANRFAAAIAAGGLDCAAKLVARSDRRSRRFARSIGLDVLPDGAGGLKLVRRATARARRPSLARAA